MNAATSRSATALALLSSALLACADEQPAADAGPPGGGAAPTEPRVPLAPTGAGELPPAIVGEGGTLLGSDVRYVPGDTLTVGYLAVPEGAGPFPALVIVHEWNGLVDRIRQVADDLAAEGYVTLAIDLYEGRTGSSPAENVALMNEVNADRDRMIRNFGAAVGHLKARPDVSGRVGAMGWCFGGGVALTFGLDGENHEATAIFYGQLVDDPERLSGLGHEVYGTFGRLDSGPSPEQVEAFERALLRAGIEHDVHVYDDVGHGFWLRVDEAPDVRTAPALDAWQRLKAYLDRTLGSGE
jgi:carboxymethylenebutenolidase